MQTALLVNGLQSRAVSVRAVWFAGGPGVPVDPDRGRAGLR